MTSAQQTSPEPVTASPARSPLFGALIGLASLGVLLQGVWAGLFVREGTDFVDSWVTVHGIDAMVTTALALAAAIVALLRLRARHDLVMGSIAFFVLLVAEMGLGYAIGDTPGIEAVHFPLAMALLGLAVWLPLRARHRG